MSELPTLTREGRRRIRELLKRRDAEMRMLDQMVGDAKSILEDFEREGEFVERLRPRERIAQTRESMLAVLSLWIAQVERVAVARQYEFEHLLLHLLHNKEQPVRGARLKELQALLGDHGVRLFSVEEEMRSVQARLGAAVNDLSRRIALGSALEGEERGKRKRRR